MFTEVKKIRAAMSQHGIICRDNIIIDGQLHRFKPEGDNNPNGWHVFYDHVTFIVGTFGCHKRDIKQKYCSKEVKSLTKKEHKEYRAAIKKATKEYEKEKNQRNKEAKIKAQNVWSSSPICADSEHPYLAKKKINPYNIRSSLYNGSTNLIIPLYDNEGTIHSLQFIYPNGEKRFLSGGAKAGHYYVLGDPETSETIYIGEGYATCASIHEATNQCVVVAFNSSNLLSVALNIRKKYPNKKFVVAADNDLFREDGNIGVIKAEEAAKAVNAMVAIPDFTNFDISNKFTDFNDLANLAGLEEVKKQLTNLLIIAEDKKMNVTAEDLLNISPSEETKDGEIRKKTQKKLLLEIASLAELFHDEQQEPYAIVKLNNCRHVYKVFSENFKNWLNHSYFFLTAEGCSKKTISDALDTISARAICNGKQKAVFNRVAQVDNKIYIDLCDDNWRVVEITKEGYKVLNESPILFTRGKTQSPLVEPKAKENKNTLNLLWQKLGLNEKQQTLILGWLLSGLRGIPTFPILNVQGEEGSGKTTLCNILRSIIDPSVAESRSLPPDEKDFLPSIVANYVVAIDNISVIAGIISDTLCRISSGGASALRKLYTNDEEVVYKIARPILLNGITDIVTRPDLLNRCINIYLKHITENARKELNEITAFFESNKAYILDELFALVAGGLKNKDSIVRPAKLSRLPDCELWITAVEQGSNGFLRIGTFSSTYEENVKIAVEEGLQSSTVISLLITFIQEIKTWEGTASQLLSKLFLKANNDGYSFLHTDKSWPRSPRGLVQALKRYKSQLRKVGISIDSYRSHGMVCT